MPPNSEGTMEMSSFFIAHLHQRVLSYSLTQLLVSATWQTFLKKALTMSGHSSSRTLVTHFAIKRVNSSRHRWPSAESSRARDALIAMAGDLGVHGHGRAGLECQVR